MVGACVVGCMVRPTNTGDEVLPFDQSDIVNGVGKTQRIVDLSGYTDEEGVYSEGVCNYCGYDRGTLKTHTEVDAGSLTCRQCNAVLGGWS